MSEHSPFRRIIAGESGLWAAPIRGGLRLAEILYASGVAVRNSRFDRRGPRHVASIPVISVGNITVGGTGKTPFVIHLVGRLEQMGLAPAVVSRGYGTAAGEPNDEERLIRKSCAGVVCVSDPDRALAVEVAQRQFGANVVVLDDGFQHRRLARTLDIVLIDATCPFGFGHLLPRGLLREPLESLRRAHLIILTRCDQVSRSDLSSIESKVHAIAGNTLQLKCSHRVTGLQRLDGTPVEEPLEGKRAVLFAGIAQPQAFLTTVRSLGIDVVGCRWWPDHHRYRSQDIDSLMGVGRYPPYDLLVTTEKDAVKLTDLPGVGQARIAVARVAIDFVDGDDTMLQKFLIDTLVPGQNPT